MSWFDAWLNGDVALSGWFPTIFIFLLGLFLGRKRIKDGWAVIKTKIHNSKNAEKENIVAMNAGSIGTVNNYFGQGLQNQMPNINQNSAVYSVVNKLVDDSIIEKSIGKTQISQTLEKIIDEAKEMTYEETARAFNEVAVKIMNEK